MVRSGKIYSYQVVNNLEIAEMKPFWSLGGFTTISNYGVSNQIPDMEVS